MNETKRICLITPGHLVSTPRLLKEADALTEAGYRVHVVASRHYAPNEAADLALIQQASWTCTRVATASGLNNVAGRLMKKAAQRLILRSAFAHPDIAAWAHYAGWKRLAAAAAAWPADLYLGHCLGALPAVIRAAKERGAACAFDLEDFHEAESSDMADRSQQLAARVMQAAWLPQMHYLTAAAPLIADAYERTYGVKSAVVLNVFPRNYAAAAPESLIQPVSADRPARLYWFSQTIGPSRGLEEMLAIMAKAITPTELQLRGYVSDSYRSHLIGLAARLGMRRPPVFLPFAANHEMARLAAEADLGLSIELQQPLNRDLCLANKIFTYMLGGIPQLLSATAAHTRLASELGKAVLLADIHRADEAAARLDAWFAQPTDVLAEARRQAWRLAQERYCWEFEKETLLKLVSGALN